MTATMMTASDEDWSQLTWEEELYHGYPDHDDDSNNDLWWWTDYPPSMMTG